MARTCRQGPVIAEHQPPPEIELRGSAALTREELLKVCDKHQTKGRILEAFAKR
jgi:hypothetical protein